MMNVSPTEVISACMSLGIFASINQRLDAETLQLIAEEFGYSLEFVSADIQETILEEEDKEEDLQERPPIVTVMGHVDHGKTSLLDYIREANVIAGEAGGITQHIGAYNVKVSNGKTITFLDTPGHEAFTAMRARGAQVTDVAIIIVAADDDVMPQTKEAINHAQAAGVPMIFAINKMDKPEANPDKIKEQLSQLNILVEDWGGKYQCQEISAKKGTNIDELLEKVILESELLDLKANPDKNAAGTVIESELDKGRGYVSTILVEGGTLKVGDMMLAGSYYGKVKAMQNERGNRIKEAGPSMPVEVLGLNGAPSAGDKFHVLTDEREVKEIASKREQLQREQNTRTQKHLTLDEIGRRLALGDFQELNVIVKGDVDGSIEALSDSLEKLSTEQIQVNIIHKAVGAITESDIMLATASDAIVVGFQVRPTAGARKIAENEEIEIRLYSIIYQAIEEIKSAMEGMLSPDVEEKVTGTAEIRETFKISKVGTIAGCFVTDGKINRNSKVRVIRDGIVVYTGELGSLKRFKDDVKEVTHGYECGLNVEKFNDIKVGDVIEAYEEVEVAKKL
jgi:translation initiation factor IF-2